MKFIREHLPFNIVELTNFCFIYSNGGGFLEMPKFHKEISKTFFQQKNWENAQIHIHFHCFLHI